MCSTTIHHSPPPFQHITYQRSNQQPMNNNNWIYSITTYNFTWLLHQSNQPNYHRLLLHIYYCLLTLPLLQYIVRTTVDFDDELKSSKQSHRDALLWVHWDAMDSNWHIKMYDIEYMIFNAKHSKVMHYGGYGFDNHYDERIQPTKHDADYKQRQATSSTSTFRLTTTSDITTIQPSPSPLPTITIDITAPYQINDNLHHFQVLTTSTTPHQTYETQRN